MVFVVVVAAAAAAAVVVFVALHFCLLLASRNCPPAVRLYVVVFTTVCAHRP